MKNLFPSTILRLLKYQCDEKKTVINTFSYERHTSLRLGGLHIMLMLLKVNEDCHKGSNMSIMATQKIH